MCVWVVGVWVVCVGGVPNYTVDMITNRRSHIFKHEVITVNTSDCTIITKEVADIMMGDT